MPTILLVDDDDQLRSVFKRALVHAGYVVQDAAAAQAALTAVQAGGIDLVITDMNMPDMDGIELLTRIRDLPDGPKVIAVSGGGQRGSESLLEVASRLGAARTMLKPFTFGELVEAVRLVDLKRP